MRQMRCVRRGKQRRKFAMHNVVHCGDVCSGELHGVPRVCSGGWGSGREPRLRHLVYDHRHVRRGRVRQL
jgi:hypothetical protein